MEQEVKNILIKLYDITKSPLTFFDIESTGLDKVSDDIIQLYLCNYDGQDFIEKNQYFNTDIYTTSATMAFDKHGLTNDFLSDYPYFIEQAKGIYEKYFFKGTVLCGYRSNNFDIPFIVEKLLQSEITKAVNILQNKRIDVYDIYANLFPNTLDKVYGRIVGGDMGVSHEAKNDVVATIKILDKLTNGSIDTSDIDIVTTSNTVDSDEFFRREGNEIFFAKGKYKDENILKMDKNDSLGFLRWITRTKTISIHSRTIANKIIDKIENN